MFPELSQSLPHPTWWVSFAGQRKFVILHSPQLLLSGSSLFAQQEMSAYSILWHLKYPYLCHPKGRWCFSPSFFPLGLTIKMSPRMTNSACQVTSKMLVPFSCPQNTASCTVSSDLRGKQITTANHVKARSNFSTVKCRGKLVLESRKQRNK